MGTPRRWELAMRALGVTYLLGAAAHVVLFTPSPAVYEVFADQALVAAYADLWESVVAPHLEVLVPLVVAFELAIGLALSWRGRAVRGGHAAGALFQAGLVLSGPWGPVNAVLAAIHVSALRWRYPRTGLGYLRRRR